MIIFSLSHYAITCYDPLPAVVLMTETSCETQTTSTIYSCSHSTAPTGQNYVSYTYVHMQMFDAYINMLHSMMISDDFANIFTLQMPS